MNTGEFTRRSGDEMRAKAQSFYSEMKMRRSVREFSSDPIPHDVIEMCLKTAGSAPSGADRQPWHFVVVSDSDTKQRIRAGAEKNEARFYASESEKDWHAALAPLGTNPSKPFLTQAPVLIAVFARTYDIDAGGQRKRNYYVKESVGIATGVLVTALHQCGLAVLTYTPSPMGFLATILDRPENERPFLVLVAGYPSDGARFPDGIAEKKPLAEIATFVVESATAGPRTADAE